VLGLSVGWAAGGSGPAVRGRSRMLCLAWWPVRGHLGSQNARSGCSASSRLGILPRFGRPVVEGFEVGDLANAADDRRGSAGEVT
jgi:hypothetical protein